MTPKPCRHGCGPGVKNLGKHGYCGTHLAELYGRFDKAVFLLNGVGLQSGRMRPDWGPTYADLTCVACDATWTGPIGEPCSWCADARDRLVGWQADKVLDPPDVDPDDATYDNVMRGWADRLNRAVDADIITLEQGKRALDRATRHRDAA